MTIDDAGSGLPADSPFLEAVGCLIQGSVSLTGNAQLFTSGVENSAVVTCASVAGPPFRAPIIQTDSSSMVVPFNTLPSGTPGALTGAYVLRQQDEIIVAIAANLVVGIETIILADASGGPLTVTLPVASTTIGRRILVKKIDPSDNVVTVNVAGGGTIDGAAAVLLSTQYQFVGVISNGGAGNAWFVIAVT